MKKILKYFLFAVLFVIPFKVSAGSISISASSTSVSVGQSVSIKVSLNDASGTVSVTSSSPTVLSGGSSSEFLDSESKTFTFYAKSEGSATVTLNPTDVTDSDEKTITGSKSITITVGSKSSSKSNSNLSGDNTLSSLEIEGIELSPKFSKNTTSYTASAKAGTEKVTIKATKSDSSSKVSGTGELEVKEGLNELEVVVTAEDGSTKTYTIKLTVDEQDPIEVKVDGKKYTVIRKISEMDPPSGYKKDKVKIKDEEVECFKHEKFDTILVLLKDSKGKTNLYVYKDNKYTLYKEYTFSKITLYPTKPNKIPAGFKKTTITINNEKVTAYKKGDVIIIYGMNTETGKYNWYRYDKQENTLQIYKPEKNDSDELKKELDLYKMITYGLAGLSFILFIALIVNIVKKRRYTKEERMQKKKDKKEMKNSMKEFRKDKEDIDIKRIMDEPTEVDIKKIMDELDKDDE